MNYFPVLEKDDLNELIERHLNNIKTMSCHKLQTDDDVRENIRTLWEMCVEKSTHSDIINRLNPNGFIPIPVIINGVAECGKGTFISTVSKIIEVTEISVIDYIYHFLDIYNSRYFDLFDYEGNFEKLLPDLYNKSHIDEAKDALKSVTLNHEAAAGIGFSIKTDAWRECAFKIKEALRAHDNLHITYVIDRFLEIMYCNFNNANTNTAARIPNLVFINSREDYDIRLIEKSFRNLGIPCISLFLIRDGYNPEWKNDCDSNVSPDSCDIVLTVRDKDKIYSENYETFSVEDAACAFALNMRKMLIDFNTHPNISDVWKIQ